MPAVAVAVGSVVIDLRIEQKPQAPVDYLAEGVVEQAGTVSPGDRLHGLRGEDPNPVDFTVPQQHFVEPAQLPHRPPIAATGPVKVAIGDIPQNRLGLLTFRVGKAADALAVGFEALRRGGDPGVVGLGGFVEVPQDDLAFGFEVVDLCVSQQSRAPADLRGG